MPYSDANTPRKKLKGITGAASVWRASKTFSFLSFQTMGANFLSEQRAAGRQKITQAAKEQIRAATAATATAANQIINTDVGCE